MNLSNIIALLGGVGMFLYGMKLLGVSLERFAGAHLEKTLERLTNNPVKGLALGAGVELRDRPGYSPEVHDPAMMRLIERCCTDLVGADRVRFDYSAWNTGSSDFGDLTCLMPGVQFNAAGATGAGHGIDYCVADPERQCVNSAKAQLLAADALLTDGAAAAKEIMAGYQPLYPNKEAFFATIDNITLDKDAVIYDADGNATVDFQNS